MDVCGKRYRTLVKKWLEGSVTVEDVVELLSVDAITRLMPRPVANHVRDRNPDTLTEATKLADDFIHTRGWNYDLAVATNKSTTGRHSKWNSRGEEKPRTSLSALSPTPQKPKMSNEAISGKPASTNNRKKFIEPKYFDTEKGPMCFRCKGWGHKGKDCTAQICTVAGFEDSTRHLEQKWNEMKGMVGMNNCTIVLDSAADTSVVLQDLVPQNAYILVNIKPSQEFTQ